jgi:hypothetical protein
VPKEWTAVCKDCEKPFTYSDLVHQTRRRRGLSAPERCKLHREQHGKETRAIASSHFGLVPTDSPNLLGAPFLGCFDRTDRAPPRLKEYQPNAEGLDLGLTDEHMLEIYAALAEYNVLVIVAPTGAGKSTVIPHRLLSPVPASGLSEDYFTPGGRPIIVTQPRRIATSDIPGVIAKKMYGASVGAGCEIGFRHGKERGQTDPWNRLVFVTDGTLANWLADQRGAEFSIVIVDEAHERSTTIDLILGLMRDELLRHPHLRLIILSATIHADSFVKFYEQMLPGRVWLRDFAECEKSFGYQVQWASGPALDERSMVDAVAAKVLELLRSTSDGGILAFLPGKSEILDAISLITDGLSNSAPGRTLVLPLYATLSQKEIDRATGELKPIRDAKGKTFLPRRVVIATNIAETSLTIPDVTHVVDSGLIKHSVWDASTRTEALQTHWHSQAGCRQRWGRAGRNRPGTAHPLYNKAQFDAFEEHTRPAVVRECLDDVLVKAKRAGVADLSGFAWLDRPPEEELRRVETLVYERRLVDADGDMTERGSEVFDLFHRIGRFVPEGAGSASRTLDMASLLILADRYGCLIEAATMLASLQHMGDDLYWRDKGLLRFESTWPLPLIDEVARIQRSLRAGCVDDLDFTLKVIGLFEGISLDGRLFGGAEWARRAHINEEVCASILADRDQILTAFIRDGRDRGFRQIDLALGGRLRMLIAHAWPDRRVVTKADGTWLAVGEEARGTVSSHSVAAQWKSDKLCVAAAFGRRDVPSLAGAEYEPVANFLIRADETAGLGTMGELAQLVRAERQTPRYGPISQRVFADQLRPVGSIRDAGEDPSDDRTWVLVEWVMTPNDEPSPIYEVEPTLLENADWELGNELEVELTRPILFAPTHETRGYVARAAEKQTYISAADLSVAAPNPTIAGLVGKVATLMVVRLDTAETPCLSLLSELEEGWAELSAADRVTGNLVGIGSTDAGEAILRIAVYQPVDSVVAHIITSFLPRQRGHLEQLKLGDRLHVSIRPRQDKEWSWTPSDDAELEDFEPEVLAEQDLRVEDGRLVASGLMTEEQMYDAIAATPAIEPSLRGLYRVSHQLHAVPDSIDTDFSLELATALRGKARALWDIAWTQAPEQTREQVKVQRASLRDEPISAFGAKRATEILDEAWEIQSARVDVEWNAGKAREKRQSVTEEKSRFYGRVSSLSEEISKLRGWVLTTRSDVKRIQYAGYAREKEAKLNIEVLKRAEKERRWEQMALQAVKYEAAAAAAAAVLGRLKARSWD